jgi:TFIIF-interacting CTD phosphatase-like protein
MKKLVILDLDHTLIHSLSFKNIDFKEAFTIRLTNETFYVHTRSYLRQFIDGLRRNIQENAEVFKVAVWTAAQRDYAIKLMNVIWPQWRSEILFLRSYEHCTVLQGGAVFKDLTKLPLGYDSILIDDNPLHYDINTANSFSVWKIRPFIFNSVDSELRDVLSYINSIVSGAQYRFAIRPKTPNHLPFT